MRSGGQRVEEDPPDDDAPRRDREEPAPADAARATVVLVDHEISPRRRATSSARRAPRCSIAPRVILEIFHRHARSREARLQVEIARLTYMAPRLRESGGGDRQRGGIGGKGAGESALELDRRKIRDRIAELRRELDGDREGRGDAVDAGARDQPRSRSSATPTPASRR